MRPRFSPTFRDLALLHHQASFEYGFGTDLQTVAKMRRSGCIIRSKSLEDIRAAFERKPETSPISCSTPKSRWTRSWTRAVVSRQLVSQMVRARIPCPSFSASVAYLDSFASGRLPANLIQGQRDLFGAHTYERLDKPGSFHTKWTEE